MQAGAVTTFMQPEKGHHETPRFGPSVFAMGGIELRISDSIVTVHADTLETLLADNTIQPASEHLTRKPNDRFHTLQYLTFHRYLRVLVGLFRVWKAPPAAHISQARVSKQWDLDFGLVHPICERLVPCGRNLQYR